MPEVHRTPGQLSGPRVPCRLQGKAEDDSGSCGTALQLLFKQAPSLDKSSSASLRTLARQRQPAPFLHRCCNQCFRRRLCLREATS